MTILHSLSVQISILSHKDIINTGKNLIKGEVLAKLFMETSSNFPDNKDNSSSIIGKQAKQIVYWFT